MRKIKGIPVILGILLLIASTSVALTPGGQQSAESLYEAAVFKKDAGGDMEGAIKIFREVIDRFPKNLEIAAKAQLQIGLCYEKLGFQEAEEAFQKVVDNYPNQIEAVKLAREKLSLLQRAKAIIEKEDQGVKMAKIPINREKYYSYTISPDGKKLANLTREGDIWITDIASGREVQITHTGLEAWFSWAPDSQKLVSLGDGLKLVSINGGTPKTLIKSDVIKNEF